MSRPLQEIVTDALRLRGTMPLSLTPMPGGANSEVFRVDADDGRSYLAKRYVRRPGDEADRLETEFGALAFLWNRGVHTVPEPVAAHPDEGIGLYGFIEGRHFAPGEIDREALDDAARFLCRIHALRLDPAAERQPVAKEACFSLAAHLAVVDERLQRLLTGAPDPPVGATLRAFLRDEFQPALDALRTRLLAEAGGQAGLRRESPREEMTLSPSDFGFQNILRRPDGSLGFIDFEYWGWDDPAKLLADFFNQPQIPVPAGLRAHFVDRLAGCYGEECTTVRLPLVLPVISLKWCLIMLNQFVRRPLADPAILRRQLDQARDHLRDISDPGIA